MRFVASNCLREGMVLGKTLFGANGEILLSKGTKVMEAYIKRIKTLGYNGLYIDDELSRDIEIEEVVSASLRNQTVQAIKKTFVAFEKNQKVDAQKASAEFSKLVNDLVFEIVSNKNMIVNMVDLKLFDDYTYYHSVNVTILSMIIGVSMGLPTEQLHKLGLGALLHDIGKIYIPKEILNKPGKLTDPEFEIMKSHSYQGYKHLKEHFNIPVTSYVAALHHHERYDGTGYPNKLMKDNISQFGRIIAVADVYDALTSDRPYRKGMLPSEAMEYIMGGGGTMFDPEMVQHFTRKVAPYPIGLCVKLSDGREGIVLENFENFNMRPLIRVYKHGTQDVAPYEISLKDDPNTRNLVISDVVRDASVAV